jgi:hypothetical protein
MTERRLLARVRAFFVLITVQLPMSRTPGSYAPMTAGLPTTREPDSSLGKDASSYPLPIVRAPQSSEKDWASGEM